MSFEVSGDTDTERTRVCRTYLASAVPTETMQKQGLQLLNQFQVQ